MSIYVLSHADVKGACMVLKAVLTMYVLINGEDIACQEERIHKMGEDTPSPLQINLQNRIVALSAINTFDELVTYVNNNPLSCFTDDVNDTITQQEIHNLDMVALHHIPNDAPQRKAPISAEGDGNCFPRTISYLLFKSENRYMEIQVHVV